MTVLTGLDCPSVARATAQQSGRVETSLTWAQEFYEILLTCQKNRNHLRKVS